MKALIIGGTGNIGTSLTRQLVAAGVDLTLFKAHVTLPEGVIGVRVVAGDRSNHDEIRRKTAELGHFDCVIDMICYEPADATCDIECFRGRTEQFIFCSTTDIYSKTPNSYPVRESEGIVGALPSFPYAHKKMECEGRLWDAHERGDFALTVIRPCFTYNETWSPGIHSFGGQSYHLDRIRRGLPIVMHGDGMTLSSATCREDVARAFVGAAGNRQSYGEDYNLGGDEWMTQNTIWRTIAGLMAAPEPDFVYIPTEILGRLLPREAEWCVQNFRHNIVFDTTKAQRELGFRYTVPFEAGARRSVEYLTRHDKIENADNYPFYGRIVDLWRKHTAAMLAEAGR